MAVAEGRRSKNLIGCCRGKEEQNSDWLLQKEGGARILLAVAELRRSKDLIGSCKGKVEEMSDWLLQKEGSAKKALTILDPKRSNAINISLTTLPSADTIKEAILKMDSAVISREGIEVRVGTK